MREETLEEQRTNLVNDLIAVSTIMDELWNYHPDNPNKKDVVSEYKTLQKIHEDIESEIANLK